MVGEPTMNASAVRVRVALDRWRREQVIAAARRSRRESRQRRGKAQELRERLLENRWELWTSGALHEPPDCVPRAWELAAQDDERVLAAAARACEEVAIAAHLSLLAERESDLAQSLVLVAALCHVTTDRVRAGDEDAPVALAGCARLLWRLDESFSTEDDPALAVAARSALGPIRLALARLGAA